MQYELGFNIESTSIRVSVFVEDLPKRIRVHATLPFVGEKTYEYLLSKAIVDANKRFIYGAFSYDRNDGEITYDYSYPITMVFSRMIFSESFMLSSGHLLTMKRFLQLKRPPKVGIREQNERKF